MLALEATRPARLVSRVVRLDEEEEGSTDVFVSVHFRLRVSCILPKDASPARLSSIAEEILTEFLSKAVGYVVEWIQMPGMKISADGIVIVELFDVLNVLSAGNGER
ncbi:ATHB-8 [Olea europaea subsp. europaea]|uniref:ATHB-8, partial n=1 Tax=Olea europaea subsp. europaea TaxID=158383 RepID=A0A8S0VE55_OLEEU|nr:ATHB-8 [Olea europaea subsp. europaea]